MEFSPFNKIVKRCLQGMELEDKGQPDEAAAVFLQAWNEAANDLEKFLAAHFLARHQKTAADRLMWQQKALQHALTINDDSVSRTLPTLYRNIARTYEELKDTGEAKAAHDLASSFGEAPSDKGPFYHGTKADLKVGDYLTAGFGSNYASDLIMNHIYFTASINGAGFAAALAKGAGPERVYIVEPTGSFEHDPNVTDKKFPGNLTRSYRTTEPLKIIGEAQDWVKQMPEELQKLRDKLANNKGEIIN
jgi:rifampin ADP-ribosylating transferase